MRIKPIKTKKEYKNALAEIERRMDAQPGSRREEELDILSTLVEEYETSAFTIDPPDPIEAILNRLDDLEMNRTDLEPMIGSRGRVSEILNRKRALTLSMIRRLSETLRLPADVLIQAYPLDDESNPRKRKDRYSSASSA